MIETKADFDLAGALKNVWASTAVTIIGGNETRGTTGVILSSIERSDSRFAGVVNIVSRSKSSVYGHRTFSSVEEIDGDLGVVWLLVGAKAIIELLPELERRRPTALVVFADGFSESGNLRDQQILTEWSSRTGVPLFGPQSIGFLSPLHGLNVFASASKGLLKPGPVAFVSQSGGILLTLINTVLSRGQGFHSGFALGGEAAINYRSLCAALLADDAVKAIGLYVENIGSVQEFARLAQTAAAANKPLVILLAGRTEQGQAMAASHSGAIATPTRLVQGIAEQFGVTMVANVDDLAASLEALEATGFQRVGEGAVGLYSDSGGMLISLHDELASGGVRMPQPSPGAAADALVDENIDRIRNPLDIGGGMMGKSDEIINVIDRFLTEEQFDIGAFLLEISEPNTVGASWITGSIRAARARGKQPMVIAGGDTREYRGPEYYGPGVIFGYGHTDAVTKLKAISSWSRGDAGYAVTGDGVRKEPLKTRVLLGQDMRKVLRDVPLRWPAEWSVARDADIRSALSEARFPAVAKAEAGLAHRAKAGGVLTNIPDIDVAVAAVDYLRSLFDSEVTLSERVPFTEEYFVGLSRTPEGDPLIAIGPGGSGVEENDVGIRLLPLSPRQQEMFIERYWPAAQRHEGLIAVIEAVSKVMDDSRIDAIDLNPLVIDETGAITALDAKVHVYS